jgi:hypothetical protein
MGTPARLFVNASELLLIRLLLECWFPNLEDEIYCPESEADKDYNCIAWAAGDCDNWWEPTPDPNDAFWPITWRAYLRDCYVAAFGQLQQSDNYEVCDPPDFNFEPGYEKVALYVDAQDVPTHMARQLPGGIWVSKLGKSWDILHQTEKGVEGARYGSAVLVMRRPIQ